MRRLSHEAAGGDDDSQHAERLDEGQYRVRHREPDTDRDLGGRDERRAGEKSDARRRLADAEVERTEHDRERGNPHGERADDRVRTDGGGKHQARQHAPHPAAW